jgi:hypothetical protein
LVHIQPEDLLLVYKYSLLLFTDLYNLYCNNNCNGFWWGILRESNHWGDPDVDGRIILRWNFKKLEGVVGTGWSWLRIGRGGRDF